MHPATVKPDLSWPTVERIRITIMKSQLLVTARRPVPSCRVTQSASVTPARACFARTGAPGRLAVRGSALPGRYARHCSPPTAAKDEIVNISMLIAWPSICQGTPSSYEHENYIQTLGAGILLAHCWDRLGAVACNQASSETFEVTAPKFGRSTNRRMSLDVSPHEWVKCTASELAGAAALCCQGSARDRQCGSHSPPPLTAAAFRLVLRLGSGFEKIKAGALFSHTENQTLAVQQTAFAGNASAQLLVLCSCVARVYARVSCQSNAVGNPLRFLFAFKVWFLTLSNGCPNLCCRVVLSGVVVLPLCTLAAVQGCIKILRILFLARVRSVLTDSPCRGVAVLFIAPKANRSDSWPTADRLNDQK